MIKVEERRSLIITVDSRMTVDEMKEVVEKEYGVIVMRIASVNQSYYNIPGGRTIFQNVNDPIRPRAFKPDGKSATYEFIVQNDLTKKIQPKVDKIDKAIKTEEDRKAKETEKTLKAAEAKRKADEEARLKKETEAAEAAAKKAEEEADDFPEDEVEKVAEEAVRDLRK